MERIWLKSYPHGVPADVDYGSYQSIADMFTDCMQTYKVRNAFTSADGSLTFEEVGRLSRDFAAWLQAMGIGKGTRVAIMLPNCLNYPVALYGIIRAGCAVVNVNPQYTPRELEHQLKDSGARALVMLEESYPTLEAIGGRGRLEHVVLAAFGNPSRPNSATRDSPLEGVCRFSDVLLKGAQLPFRPVDLGRDDVAFLQYTGGTTGSSKAAKLLHRNIVINIEQAAAWFSPGFKGETPAIVTAMPLYHIFSLTVNCLLAMKLGGVNILIANPRDIPAFVAALRANPFNMITGVNTLYNTLLNNADFRTLDFSGLRICAAGGMPLQKSVADEWKRVTGCPLLEGYGLTETSPCVTMNPLDQDSYNGSVGLPMPSTYISIRNESNEELPLGDFGEICIKGPQVMDGYWEQPDETAKAISADGYLHTGDIGVMDGNGFLRIVDRKKDMIIVSGFNVYPTEIEQVIGMHPGVLEVAAVGVSDKHSGEAVKVYVVKKDPGLSAQAIFEHCSDKLTGYKRPKHVEFRAELPKSNVGKLLRRALRQDLS